MNTRMEVKLEVHPCKFLTVVLLVLITFMFTNFLVPVLHAGYLRHDTALSQFVQFVEDRFRLLECSPASCLGQ